MQIKSRLLRQTIRLFITKYDDPNDVDDFVKKENVVCDEMKPIAFLFVFILLSFQ